VATRQKEIQFSSRTRAVSNDFKQRQRIRYAVANLLPKLPPELQDTEAANVLKEIADHKVYNLVQLIYRSKAYEGNSKDYEFSRLTMNEHWLAGYEDAQKTLSHEEIFDRPDDQSGAAAFDFLKNDRTESPL
jgi:NTE family protein